MAALHPSSAVVYPSTPCGMRGSTFVAYDTGLTETFRPHAFDQFRPRLGPAIVATRSEHRTGQANRQSEPPAMRALLHLKPGQKGTKRLVAEYGDSLVCVRYRYDAQRRKRFKTVELIIAERDWSPPAPRVADDALVAIRVGFAEVEVRQRVKRAGGRWDPDRKVWELRYAEVVALELEARIVPEKASDAGCHGGLQMWMLASNTGCKHLIQDACAGRRMVVELNR